MKPTDTVKAALGLPFKAIGLGATRLVKGWVLTQQSGAKLAKSRQLKNYLSKSNQGLLLDGQHLRLSETESFKNIAVIARTGAGKTSRFIIPNVLDKTNHNASMVVNDPRGEVFTATSGAMQRAGYDIKVIAPHDAQHSSRFNPLHSAGDDIELEAIAELLVRAGNPGDKDTFWNAGATRLVSVLLKSLRNAERSKGQPLLTLHNLAFLLQNFGADGSPLTNFMADATIDPDCPHDQSLWHEWKGVLTGNPEGVQSFVLNALTALRSLSNRNVAWLTSASDFSLDDLRRRKTIIYFITPAQHQDFYAFLISVFFRSVFNMCMREIPGKNDLPVYLLIDEFGHLTIPGFVATANTIRAYKCSMTIVLQSIAQLADRYGRDTAYAIQGGFNTAMTYPGADPQTAAFFESISGKVRERQREDWKKLVDTYREFNLLNASDIRTMANDTALIVSANRDPVLLPTQPYFLESRFKKLAALKPISLARRQVDLTSIARITL